MAAFFTGLVRRIHGPQAGVLVLIALFLPGLCSSERTQAEKASNADRLLREGLAAFHSGDLALAVRKTREAYRIRPQNAETRLQLGRFLSEQDPRSVEARTLLESVIDRFPVDLDLRYRVLDAALAAGDTTKAESLLSRSQSLMDRNDSFAARTIYLLIRHGQIRLASEQTDRLSERLQTEVRALRNSRGTAEPEGKPTDRSAPDSEGSTSRTQAVLARRVGEVFFLRGLIAATDGRKSEAMEALQLADRYDFPPRDSFEMIMLADCLDRLGEGRLAVQAYQEYVKHHPADDEAQVRLGSVLFAAGDFESARKAFEVVWGRNPRFPSVNYHLGAALLELKLTEEAERRLSEELAHDPRCARCLTKLAQIEYLRGRNERCREILDRSLALDQKWTETYLVFGLLYNRLGQYELAVQNLETVVRDLPDFPTGRLQLSVAYQRLGNAEKAKEHREAYNRLIEARRAAVASQVQ
jgi:tetratricopeptide (TPR) repeat protein